MKKKTIESVAEILLAHKVSFEYESSYLKVTDGVVRYDLFGSVSYHTKTGALVFWSWDYVDEISFSKFMNYFEKIPSR